MTASRDLAFPRQPASVPFSSTARGVAREEQMVRADGPDADQAEAYEAAWRTFMALERAAPHRRDWARWADGRGPHLLLLARLVDPRALARVRAVQARLASIRGLEVHPTRFLHISVQSFGFLAPPNRAPGPEEIAPDELAAATTQLADVLPRRPPIRVGLGAPNAFQSSVLIETHSGGQLQALRRAARATAPVLERLDPFDTFLFHLTVGYFAPGVSLDAVRAALIPLRGRQETAFVVETLDLVALPTHQRQAYPPLRPIARFRLGRQRPVEPDDRPGKGGFAGAAMTS